MALFSVAAGYIGWRSATKPIYRRTYVTGETPNGMSRREYDRALRRRRKQWRLLITALYAIVGAIVGVLFLMFLARPLSEQLKR